MSAVNMCFNGIIGETTCMNGADIVGTTYRFGYRVEPMITMFPQEQWDLQRMLMFMRTGQDIKKRYVLIAVPYEATFLKGINDQLVMEFEEAKQIADTEERDAKLKELQDTVQARLDGTLFEEDTTQAENVAEQPKKKGTKKTEQKPKTDPPPDTQQKLF